MTDWKPEYYNDEPMTNAILNVAASLARCAYNLGDCASATRQLHHGLQHTNGLSIAEAIEAAAEPLTIAISEVADALQASFPTKDDGDHDDG